jgi:hypothetical protein
MESKYILFFNQIGIDAIDQVSKMLRLVNYTINWTIGVNILMDLQLVQKDTVFSTKKQFEKTIRRHLESIGYKRICKPIWNWR